MKLSSPAKNYASSLINKDFANLTKELDQNLRRIRASAILPNTQTSLISKALEDCAEKEIKAMLYSYIEAYKQDRISIDKEDEDEILEETRRRIKKYATFAESSSFPEFKLPNTNKLIPNFIPHFQAKLERLLSEVKCEIDIFNNERRMEKKMREIESKRYNTLRWIYDKVGGQQYKLADLRELVNSDLGYSENELTRISDYLEGESLINQMDDCGLLVQLTHKGIVEIESSIKNPQNSTEHFPLTVIQNFNAPVGSVQTGNNNTANVNQNFGQNLSEILQQLAILRNEFQKLPESEKEEAIEIVDAIEVEVKSEKPSKGKIKSFLLATKDFAVKTGTEVTSKILTELIKSQIGIGEDK